MARLAEFGWLNLFSEHLDAWTEEQRSSALIHELWHVKRADFLVMVLVRLSLAAFWFNPLSWFVFRRLKNEQEEACDELVLRMGIKPSTYAANLLFFKSAAGSGLGQWAGLLGLSGHGKSAFNERLAAILKQKWSFQEVKMKTKIILVCAVVLAVGIIGMARPSPALTGKTEAGMSVFFGAGPGVQEKMADPIIPGSQEAEQPQEQSQVEEKKAQEKEQPEQAQKEHQAQEQKGQKEQFLAQEKQEQEKQVQEHEEQELKEKTKKAVVWTIKEGEKHKYRIKIQEEDEVKTIVIDKPVIVKEIKDGKVFLITPEGKEVKIMEGDPVHLEIKGGKLEFIKEGKVLKVGKDGRSFYVTVKPDVDISEAIKIALKDIPDIKKSVAIALQETIPVTIAKALDIAEPHITWVGSDEQEKIREKLREAREKLKAVEENKLELREVDEALADLEEDLEKMSQELSTVALKLEHTPFVYTITKKAVEEEAAAEVHVDIAEGAKKDTIKVVVSKDGLFELYYRVDAGEKGRETYEKIVARVKKDLPEGFTLDPEFDEESGRITLKISGPGDKETPKELVEKITESIREERKERKE
ncbi:MAG: M56 family metallopeptidase [Candidatus Aminicenantales bacterium]